MPASKALQDHHLYSFANYPDVPYFQAMPSLKPLTFLALVFSTLLFGGKRDH
jgi:hypothetical protein